MNHSQQLSNTPSNIAGPKRRKDRLGNTINGNVNKRWQVTFRDNVQKGQSVATVHLVESWK